MAGLAPYLISLLTFAIIYSIVALGLNLQWGYTGLFNLSVAAFWGIGAYTATLITKPPAADTAFGFNVPFLWVDIGGIPLPIAPAVIVAALVSGVVALIIGVPTLSLDEEYLAIGTLGLAEIVRLILMNERWLAGGVLGTGVENPLRGLDGANLLLLITALGAVLATYGVLSLLVQSPWGRVLRSIREDEVIAEALGKNVFSRKMQSFVLGSMVMGIGGALTALQLNYISPSQFTADWTIYFWIAVILGGGGSIRGSIFGGILLTVLLEGTRFIKSVFVIDAGSSIIADIRILTIGLLLIVFLIYRPQGVFGDRAIVRDLRG